MSRSSNQDVISTALDIAQIASSAQFTPHPYLNVAANTLIQIVRIIQSSKGDPALIDLVQDVTGVMAILSKWAENTSQANITPGVEESLTSLIQTLQSIVSFAEKRSSKHLFWNRILNSKYTKELDEYRSQLTLASSRFMVVSQVMIEGQLSDIAKSVDQVAARIAIVRKDQVISELKARSALDAFNIEDGGTCMEGTREQVIQQILSWFDDPQSPHKSIWVNGPAGSGKSTIARTIADIMRQRRSLAASFFFGYRVQLAVQFVATIAYQLCFTIPGLLERIVSVLELDPAILDSSITQQMEKLVVSPLQELSLNENTSGNHHGWLILLDGIDECHPECQQDFFQIIRCLIENHSVPLRVFVSSRDSYAVRQALNSSEVLPLDITTVTDDIEAFFIFSFARIKATHPGLKGYAKWPPAETIEKLVQKAGGLFIWASTVIKFLENSFQDPNEGLQKILTSLDGGGPSIDSLEAIYTNILRQVPIDSIEDVKAIMNWLIFGRETIKSMNLCDKLFDFAPGYSEKSLGPLMSVINVPDPRRATSTASAESMSLGFFDSFFPDMLKSLPRLKQHDLETFYCDQSHAHPMLAGCWLQYYEKYGNDYSESYSSYIKGGPLIEAYRRQSYISDIFDRISTHCADPSAHNGPLFMDDRFVNGLQTVDLTKCLIDCADEPKIWWFQLAPILNFVALCLSIPERVPQVDPATLASIRRLVEYIQTYWSRFPESIRDHLPDMIYLTSNSPKRDISRFSQPSVTHSIFLHKTQRANQLTYGILIGQTLENIRDSLLTPNGMPGPDGGQCVLVANWLIKGWNIEGEGHSGKNGFHPYIKTEEIPYLLTIALSKASFSSSTEDQLRRSVFMQGRSLNQGPTRVGGLLFSFDDFNYFSNVAKSYINRTE